MLSVFQAIKNAHPARREPDERVGQRAGFSVLLRAGILPGAAGFLRAACLLFGAFGFLRAALLLGAALLLRTLRFLSAALLHTGYDLGDDGGALELSYQLDLNGKFAAMHDMELRLIAQSHEAES